MQANLVHPSAKYKTAATEDLKNTVENKLREHFGEGLISASIDYDFPVFILHRICVIEVLNFLYHDFELQFQFLTTIAGLHYPEQKGLELGLMYQLHSLQNNYRIRIKTFMPIENPKIGTATNLFKTADWMERQEFDFFGIHFEGHPNLKRILNMDEMTYHPMRKEYPLEDAHREDKDDSFFGR